MTQQFLDQTAGDDRHVAIGLLGEFQVMKHGRSVMQRAEKTERLLSMLAMQPRQTASRGRLLETVWPKIEPELAGQSLNSLVHSLRRLLSDALGGEAPIVVDSGMYRLNLDAGIRVDALDFETAILAGDAAYRDGQLEAAESHYRAAVALYQGDLLLFSESDMVVDRQRLRARFQSALSRLAVRRFAAADYDGCLHYAYRLLKSDPCCEDAHRWIMRCHARRGERTQAMRQYQLCVELLKTHFVTTPEAETVMLHESIVRNSRAV